jgi:Cu2+-exporting ATPase
MRVLSSVQTGTPNGSARGVNSATCAHCQRPLLPFEAGEHVARGAAVYCCAGCASARAVIERMGLLRFDTLGGAPGPVARVDVDEAGTLALETALGAARSIAGSGPCRLAVDVDGVTCASCAWLVQKVSAGVSGVAGATLNPARGQLELTVGAAFSASSLSTALAEVGQRVTPSLLRRAAGVVDELVLRFGVSAAAAMAAMISSFALFFGLPVDSGYGHLFTTIAALGAFVAVAFGGWSFLLGAWRSLARGAPTMDVPIALGMVGAFGACVFAAHAGNVVSFDTVAVFVTLMLLGRLLERRLVERHRALLLASDDDVAGLEVRRLDGDVARLTKIKDVAQGDRLRLARGELCPVDATAVQARTFSFAWLTGESDARGVDAGAVVPAGAHVDDARGADVVATRPFSATQLAALLATSPSGHEGDDRSAASGLFPWLAKAWVFGVFVVAATGVVVWRDAGVVRLLDVVSALLVVTCPCAFGIAAPLAVERALVLLRGRGVFVKSARLWWRASSVTHAVFDKTGTLTLEEPALDDASTKALSSWSARDRAVLAVVVGHSNHGRSRAIARALARLDGHAAARLVDVAEEAGRGLVARVEVEGVVVVDVVVERDAEDGAATRVTVGDRSLALSFIETLRAGVARELERLRALGVDVWIATGDDDTKAQALAARLGVPADHVRARCTPDDKAALVRSLGGARHVLAVGDGVNDAAMFAEAAVCGVPALDRAHLPARADFLLLGTRAGGSFGSVVDVVVVARRVRAVLRGLLATATVYNVAVVGAGLLGLLTPLLVAVLMPVMSVSLLLAALVFVRLPRAHATTTTTTTTSPLTIAAVPSTLAASTTEVPA